MFVTILVTLCAVFVTTRVMKYRADAKALGGLPSILSLAPPMGLPGVLLPTTWRNASLYWPWKFRTVGYQWIKSDTFSFISIFGRPMVHTSSLDVFKQALAGMNNTDFTKGEDSTEGVMIWGMNVVSAVDETWKRHRRIVGPSFNPNTYAMVWKEACNIYKELYVVDEWERLEFIGIEDMNKITSKFALILVARCGFGLPFPWEDEEPNTKGGMSFSQALEVSMQNIIIRLAAPQWAYHLPLKMLRDTKKSYQIVADFMASFVTDRKKEIADMKERGVQPKTDLFSRLVLANDADESTGLSDEELIGNVFVFIFAGHETTAHTLSATLGMLALYPEEQAIAVEQIHAIIGTRDAPKETTFEDFAALDKVLACFAEGARMFPPAPITRDTTQDIVITVPDQNGAGIRGVPIAAGTRFFLDIIGHHYNPKYFPDPEVFRPSRWYGKQDSEYVFFGLGPRSCMGRKFALAEAVCFLALLLRDWVVELPLDEGETREQWREKNMQIKLIGLAWGPAHVPLRLRRRR